MISSGLRTDQLTDSQKNWYAIATCGAIIADGNIAPEELRYLEKALSFLPSAEKIEALIQAVKEQRLPPLPPLKEIARDVQIRMLIELTLIISSDNSMSTKEMEYLFNVSKKLGISQEFTQIVIRWANEGILWRKKLQHLLNTGMELEPEYD